MSKTTQLPVAERPYGDIAKWVKRTEGRGEDKLVTWEHEGQIPIKVTDMEEVEVGGFYRDYD